MSVWIGPIQLRRGTAAEWASANPVLLAGEKGLETDTGLEKNGDGVTPWNSLGYSGASAADKHYSHTQNQASATWVIPHNLNKRPAVQVFDSSNNEVFGDITYDDLNQLTITFSAQFTGKAYLN